MFKKLLFSLTFITLTISAIQAQTWESDYLSNSIVKVYKTNKKLGLVRLCGEGKVDSVPSVYEYIYKYENKFGSLNYIGMKDSVWYKLNFTGNPTQIPYKNYIGKGLFIETKNNQNYLYSIEKGLLIVDSTNRFSKFVSDLYYNDCDGYLCSLEEKNSSLYCFPTPNFKFNNTNSYCISSIDIITFRDTKVKSKKNKVKQPKYGLIASYLYSEGPEILPFVYDTIFTENYCAFAKKNGIYEIYNGLNNRLPDSENPPKSFENGFIDYSKNSKHGLMDYYGNTILECKYDKVWVDKLMFAQLGDSLFCYNENKLIHTIKTNSKSKIHVTGAFDYQPFIISDTTRNRENKLFYYNSYSSKILDLNNYDSSYFYDVFNDEYYMCVKKNDKYGIVNFDNKLIKPIEYDYIGKSLRYNFELNTVSFHKVTKNEKIGFISSSLKEYIPIGYDAVAGIDEESRMMPEKFILKKSKLWYMYDYKNKQLINCGFDTIIISEKNRTYDSYGNKKPIQIHASKNGETFLIDSTGKKYYDFNFVEFREAENQFFLEEKHLNKNPVNIAPLVTINSIEDFNQDHSYAIVLCLNRHFVINKYGEMSASFEKMIELYDYKNEVIYGSKSKKSKANALYSFSGNEVGQLSKYNWTQHYEDTKTHEHYFVFKNSKNKMGLMNAKGELLLECKYYSIYPNEKGNFDFWLEENDWPTIINPTNLKALPWSK